MRAITPISSSTVALLLLPLSFGCRPPDVRTFHRLERALKEGRIRARTPVSRVLALGAPQERNRTGPFEELEYGYHRPDRDATYHRVQLFALRGRLVAAYDHSHRGGSCGASPCRKKLFDILTRKQRERWRYLRALAGCRPPRESSGDCESLATFHRDGRGTPPNPRKARDILERRCRRGDRGRDDHIHCFTLAKWLRAGKLGPPDRPAARRFAARSCRLGYRPACALR